MSAVEPMVGMTICELRRGCIYVIASGEFVKIGFSADPKTRLANIQAGNPNPVTLEHLATGTMEDEKQIHYCLRSAGLGGRGEWYKREHVLGVIDNIRADKIEEAILAAVEINRTREWGKHLAAYLKRVKRDANKRGIA